MYKGLACEQPGIEHEHGIFCNKHVKFNVDTEWTPAKEELFKSKTVPELKKMLREKKLMVCGTKKELVNRWFAN
jgi:hypothetical protein